MNETLEWRFKGSEKLATDRTLCMGILNVTPDSFSDGGQHQDVSNCLKTARDMILNGADIIDIGGESTRPGCDIVSAKEEQDRIIPVFSAISNQILNDTSDKLAQSRHVLLSVDTYKAITARAALENGCHIINDIHGFRKDPDMAHVASEFGCGVILMFNNQEQQNDVSEKSNIVTKACTALATSIEIAIQAGVDEHAIMLDPGIGFGTTREEDVELIKGIREISFNGRYKILAAGSRKRIVNSLLGEDHPPEKRVLGSVGLALASVSNGADCVRVHDVLETREALRVFEKLTAK